VIVTATNSAGSSSAASSPTAVVPGAPANTAHSGRRGGPTPLLCLRPREIPLPTGPTMALKQRCPPV
jgi:hypothetical protein